MSRVLIIDDEPAIRRAMHGILENEGYAIAEAASAVEAIPMLNDNVFDAIFCDIKMPQMDGIEFLEKAKTLTDAPIIIISGHGTIDIAVDVIRSFVLAGIDITMNQYNKLGKQCKKPLESTNGSGQPASSKLEA